MCFDITETGYYHANVIFDFGHFFIHLGVDSKIALFEIVLKVHCCKVHEIKHKNVGLIAPKRGQMSPKVKHIFKKAYLRK